LQEDMDHATDSSPPSKRHEVRWEGVKRGTGRMKEADQRVETVRVTAIERRGDICPCEGHVEGPEW
jgi:hypothetical protein